jgi:hypothetical protein
MECEAGWAEDRSAVVVVVVGGGSAGDAKWDSSGIPPKKNPLIRSLLDPSGSDPILTERRLRCRP